MTCGCNTSRPRYKGRKQFAVLVTFDSKTDVVLAKAYNETQAMKIVRKHYAHIYGDRDFIVTPIGETSFTGHICKVF